MTAPHVALFHVRTQRPRAAAGYQALLDTLNDAAVAAVEGLGWTASLHAAAEDPEPELRQASRDADVVVILGGDDIEPGLYGQSDRRPRRSPYERRADRLQIAVIMDAVGTGRPLLGLCRGHQLLNVALGGSLLQHVPGHRGPGAEPFIATPLDLSTVAPDLRGSALCTHHQAIDELGEGLVALTRSRDGVIEAIAHESLPLLGVQWHPEHPITAETQLGVLLRALHAGELVA